MAESYILLVEDNPDDAFLASRIIRKICSDEILVARDGEEASELLQRMTGDGSYRLIRLVLLDLKLPKISGLDLLQAIRKSDELHSLSVAVLTSSDNEMDQERCFELGVLDYLYKPMTADRLESLLRRREDG
ncbi:Putative response regulator [Citrifermentans bremense]|uniref:Response regulator n=1 Tax=Citrifermentans bremense TaxID=60035 RepID=A0A6S6M0S3_9BACT|nr:response regulator [Citrifermentans bremense]BCG47198.1 Putative response regulator [Citrifermentans bremense]